MLQFKAILILFVYINLYTQFYPVCSDEEGTKTYPFKDMPDVALVTMPIDYEITQENYANQFVMIFLIIMFLLEILNTLRKGQRNVFKVIWNSILNLTTVISGMVLTVLLILGALSLTFHLYNAYFGQYQYKLLPSVNEIFTIIAVATAVAVACKSSQALLIQL